MKKLLWIEAILLNILLIFLLDLSILDWRFWIIYLPIILILSYKNEKH